MNRPSPIWAAGWISMPVSARVSVGDRPRQQRHAGLVQRMRDAVGQQRLHARPGRRGSPPGRRRAPRDRGRGRRRRRGAAPRRRGRRCRGRASVKAVARPHCAASQRTRARYGAKNGVRDVALAGVGQDHDDPLAARLAAGAATCERRRTAPRRRRCRRARPRARAAAPGRVDRVLVGDGDDLVEQLAVEHRRARSPRRSPGSGADRAAGRTAPPSRPARRRRPAVGVALAQVPRRRR